MLASITGGVSDDLPSPGRWHPHSVTIFSVPLFLGETERSGVTLTICNCSVGAQGLRLHVPLWFQVVRQITFIELPLARNLFIHVLRAVQFVDGSSGGVALVNAP